MFQGALQLLLTYFRSINNARGTVFTFPSNPAQRRVDTLGEVGGKERPFNDLRHCSWRRWGERSQSSNRTTVKSRHFERNRCKCCNKMICSGWTRKEVHCKWAWLEILSNSQRKEASFYIQNLLYHLLSELLIISLLNIQPSLPDSFTENIEGILRRSTSVEIRIHLWE